MKEPKEKPSEKNVGSGKKKTGKKPLTIEQFKQNISKTIQSFDELNNSYILFEKAGKAIEEYEEKGKIIEEYRAFLQS